MPVKELLGGGEQILIGGVIGGIFGVGFGYFHKSDLEKISDTDKGKSLLVFLFDCLLFGLIGSLGGWLYGSLSFNVSDGLIGIAIGGFLGWHKLGGNAFIQHFILRFILYVNGDIPLNYVDFLDYATERIFLYKIGGSYVFIHRLLMEYFTTL